MASEVFGFDEKKLKVSINKAINDAIDNIDINSKIKDYWKVIYPVGSIYISTVQTNPAAIFGGEWISFGIGKVLVGVDASDPDFSSAKKTGGSKELQSHSHAQNAKFEVRPGDYASVYTESGWGASVSEGSTWNAKMTTGGSSKKGNLVTINGQTATAGTGNSGNMPPYITVYMFERTG